MKHARSAQSSRQKTESEKAIEQQFKKKKKKAIEVELVFGGSVQEVARLVQPEQSERGEITHKPCLQAHRLADL